MKSQTALANKNIFIVLYYSSFVGLIILLSRLEYSWNYSKILIVCMSFLFAVKLFLGKKVNTYILVLDIVIGLYFIFFDRLYYSENTIIYYLVKPIEGLMFKKRGYYLQLLQLYSFIILAYSVLRYGSYKSKDLKKIMEK